jgi:hypothetical protein
MQRKNQTSTQQHSAKLASAPRGLTPIDPRDFKLVAGGLPKGGWGSSSGTTPLCLPKGGW